MLNRREMLATAAVAVAAPTALLAAPKSRPESLSVSSSVLDTDIPEGADYWFSDHSEHRYFVLREGALAKPVKITQIKPGQKIAFQWHERDGKRTTVHTSFVETLANQRATVQGKRTNVVHAKLKWSSDE